MSVYDLYLLISKRGSKGLVAGIESLVHRALPKATGCIRRESPFHDSPLAFQLSSRAIGSAPAAH
jgi:hypothetical protein